MRTTQSLLGPFVSKKVWSVGMSYGRNQRSEMVGKLAAIVALDGIAYPLSIFFEEQN